MLQCILIRPPLQKVPVQSVARCVPVAVDPSAEIFLLDLARVVVELVEDGNNGNGVRLGTHAGVVVANGRKGHLVWVSNWTLFALFLLQCPFFFWYFITYMTLVVRGIQVLPIPAGRKKDLSAHFLARLLVQVDGILAWIKTDMGNCSMRVVCAIIRSKEMLKQRNVVRWDYWNTLTFGECHQRPFAGPPAEQWPLELPDSSCVPLYSHKYGQCNNLPVVFFHHV